MKPGVGKLRPPQVGAQQPAKPKAPPAPQPAAQPLPVDPVHTAQVAGINRRLGDSLAFLGQEESQIGQEYGLTDTSNPFNRAAMLQRSYDQQQRFNTNSMAARGQLYSGALQARRNETQFGFLRDKDSLSRDFTRLMSDIQRRRAQAQGGAQDELVGAEDDRVGRALANRPDPGSVPLPDEPARSSLPPNYESWDLAKKRRYWARRRKQR